MNAVTSVGVYHCHLHDCNLSVDIVNNIIEFNYSTLNIAVSALCKIVIRQSARMSKITMTVQCSIKLELARNCVYICMHELGFQRTKCSTEPQIVKYVVSCVQKFTSVMLLITIKYRYPFLVVLFSSVLFFNIFNLLLFLL